MTKEPWSFDDAVQWERLALEAQQRNDVIIGPYLDNRSLWRRLIALFCAAGHACELMLSVFVQRERQSYDTEDIQFAVVEPLASRMG